VPFQFSIVRVPGDVHGSVPLHSEGGTIETAENITETLVKEGFVSVRREAKSGTEKLIELEDAARAAGKGKWGPPEQLQVSCKFSRNSFTSHG
jgi:hypothetical protein